jgi:SWI/SNF-related matrix-associated actin-dependent regulator of chromatin subfamily A3
LNLIQIYLHRKALNTHNVQRIDGDCSTAKRERILEDFAEDPNLRILIMTTGTGAVG